MVERQVALPPKTRRISLALLLYLGGGVAWLIALFCSPTMLGRILSSDGLLEPHTVFEIQCWRIALTVAGAGLLALAFAWNVAAGHPLRGRLEADFEKWRESAAAFRSGAVRARRAATIALSLSIVVAVVVARLSVAHMEAQWFRLLALESGVVETLQAAFLLGAGAILGRLAWASLRKGNTGAVVGLGFALVLVLGAGEEISWGQHWLGFATPEALAAVNLQGEFNFHNIGSYWMNHAQVVLLVALAAILPILGVGYPQIVYVLDRLTIPSAPPAFAPLVIVAATLDEHDRIARLWGDPPWRLSEGRELVYTLCLLLMVWLMARERKNRAALSESVARL